MQERELPCDLDKLERIRKSISNKLEEVRRSSGSDKAIGDLQRRAVMQLQQFYKFLLSDYSPKDVKQMKTYLRHNGFPELREALRMKPAKISEKLRSPLSKLDCEPSRKKQLEGGLERIRETVADLDREIFNCSNISKKEQKMLERLEEIEGKIGNILYLGKKINDLKSEMQSYVPRIPLPEGTLDIDAVARRRLDERRRELVHTLEKLEIGLREALGGEMMAMNKLKDFLHSSGTLLDPVVRVMPRIREMTSSVVKSAGMELTEWDVGVAISRLDKFVTGLPDDDPLRKLGNEQVREALQYIHRNAEVLADYNSVLVAREKKRLLEDDIAKIRDAVDTLEKDEGIRKEREAVVQEAAKNLEAFVQIKQELERSAEELDAETAGLGGEDGVLAHASLDEEVGRMLAKL